MRPRVPAPDHGHQVAVGHPGRQRGVDGAGGRLDQHGVLVGQRVGHGVELAGVGHQRGGRPAAAGVGAEPGLEPGGQARRRPGCRTGRCARRRTGRTTGSDVAGRAAEHRLDDGPGARGERSVRRGRCRRRRARPTTSWPGTKGKRHHVLEVARACGRPGWRGRSRRCPTAAGAGGTSRRPGGRAASASSSCSGPMPAPRPEPSTEATHDSNAKTPKPH